MIRFRVVDEIFTEELPKPPDAAEKQETNKIPPYVLHVSEHFIVLINSLRPNAYNYVHSLWSLPGPFIDKLYSENHTFRRPILFES